MPSALDDMGLCKPRMPSGASGFMSKVSRWLGPPHWKRKMTDFARATGFFAALASAASSLGKDMPNMPMPPTCKRRRRVIWKSSCGVQGEFIASMV